MKVPLLTERNLPMLYNNNNLEILGLEDAIVEKVESKDDLLEISITLKRKEHSCPACHTMTNRIHDYRRQTVKDIPAFGKKVVLYLRKRRYVCPCCGKRFFEQNHFLPRYYRRTQRSILSILHSLGDKVSGKHVAEENDSSCTTVWRYFKLLNYRCTSLPTVLSLDEFKGNANGEKYQSILTNPVKKRILDILPTRYEGDLISYFKDFSTRYSVQYFVIDMSDHFRRVGQCCFPNAKIVADRYHVVRQVYWAMENVRKEEQSHLSERFRKYFKRSRKLTYKDPKDLTFEEKERLSLMFEISPKLARAYYLKNKFLGVLHAKNSREGRKKLANWLLLAEYEDIPEFKNCIQAYRNWFQEILNALDVPYSNGYTEGCNNKTKVIKRVSFGIRNFERLRTRILHIANMSSAS